MSSEPFNKPQLEQAAASDQSIQRVHAILLREKPEPKEGFTPMPLFLLGLISTMIFISCIYIVHYRGGFDPLVYDERVVDPGASAGGPKAPVDPKVAGKRSFTQVCATCHQATGLGVPSVYPPLAGSEWVTGSEERVISVLLHGLQGPITVEGKSFNNNMPAFGQGSAYNWNDQKIAEVLTYIRSEWGNTASPITAEQVAAIRTKEAGRTKPWSEAELQGK